MNQKEKAVQFRALHKGPSILILPNAWDAVSARIFEMAGFPALATTSSGVAATLGYPDGQFVPKEAVQDVTARITRVVDCPVTVDLEAGYGNSIPEIVAMVQKVIEAGAAGFNLEDTFKHPRKGLVDVSYQVELIQALRELAAGMDIPFVINARTDVFLLKPDDQRGGLEEGIRRARAYFEAGADCVFPITLRDREVIAEFVKEVGGPVNLLAGPVYPPIPEMAELGVARVTFASGILGVLLGQLKEMAQDLYRSGTLKPPAGPVMSHAEMMQLWK